MTGDTDRIRTQIRLPSDLYEAIREIAESRGQSLNEAMIRLLRVGLDSEQGQEDSEESDKWADLEARVRRLEQDVYKRK